ncbi:hypothetical protein FO519_004364 [Halicephalobus sp. NKZ332]|nr:hypothetical protein FO519_004364 [Halicephalobus sp. NKZ332]
MEEAVEVIGDNAVSNARKRAADLGLRFNEKGQFGSFGDYMHAKVTKLLVQCNETEEKKSQLFSGLSFYVDGRTDPPAHEIRELVTTNASAGLGPNWILAKMATKKAKPKGQFYIPQENAIEFIKEISIEDLPAVGWSSKETIQNNLGHDIEKCSQLMNFSLENLRNVLGVTNGEKIFKALRGKCEDLDFDEVVDRKSVSVNVNFGIRLKNEKDLSDLLFGIAHELSDRLQQIDKTGIHLTLKYLMRMPDAPFEPAKYGAHGPVYPVRKSGNLPKSTSNENLIHGFSLKLSKELNPSILDIRGVSLHINKLNFLNQKPTVKKEGKSLWNFLNLEKSKKGTKTKEIKKPEPSEKKVNEEVFEEMDMKISEVTSEVNHREMQTRILGSLPEKPKVKSISSNNLIAMMIDNKRINIAGIIINYRKAPNEEAYRQVMYHFKRCIDSSQLKDLKRILFQRKLYDLGDSEEGEDEKQEFESFLNDIGRNMKKKERREKSPELFDEEGPPGSEEGQTREPKSEISTSREEEVPESRREKSPESREEIFMEFRNGKKRRSREEISLESRSGKTLEFQEIILSPGESDEDCQIIGTNPKKSNVKVQNKKTKKKELQKSRSKVDQKITNLIKKRKLDHTLINIDESSSEDDCVILDPGSVFVK